MEPVGYWMWTKRKQAQNDPPYDESSWEEQAFAEDTAGALGGCIWPPRSYSCTFCRREFRSAQALGGHMNVHRRDRARLKQSPTSHTDNIILPNQNNLHNQYRSNLFQNYPHSSATSLGFQYPSHICSLVYTSPNPNSNRPGSLASPTSPSRVSTNATVQENPSKKTSIFTPFLSSSVTEEKSDKVSSTPGSLRDIWPVNLEEGEEKKKKKKKKNPSSDTVDDAKSGCRSKLDHLKTDLSVSLNLVFRRSRPINISDDEDEEKEKHKGCKRRRTDPVLPFFLKSNNNIEELDLELRLGVERA